MSDAIAAFCAMLPAHKAGLTITHNDHLGVYETVKQQVEEDHYVSRKDFVSDAECDKAISTNELWALQWYPETSVGFHKLFASTLEALLAGVEIGVSHE